MLERINESMQNFIPLDQFLLYVSTIRFVISHATV